MNFFTLALCGLLLLGQGPVTRVESTFDKKVNFQSLRTYTWIRGYDAHNPEVHKMIVAAIEEEMARQGFKRVDSGADVTLAYYTVRSMEVDLKALDRLPPEDRANAPQKILGRLLVMMRNPADEARLWSASTREYVNDDLGKFPATIRGVVTRMFDTYPGRKSSGE
jgi:hypothetical protein